MSELNPKLSFSPQFRRGFLFAPPKSGHVGSYLGSEERVIVFFVVPVSVCHEAVHDQSQNFKVPTSTGFLAVARSLKQVCWQKVCRGTI